MATPCTSDACNLQNAVNRFSADSDVGFTPIAVDGNIGKQTATAVFYALTSIQNIAGDPLGAGALIDALNTPSDIAAQAASLASLINSGAVALGLGIVPAPPVASTPQAQLVPRTAQAAALQAQILARKNALQASFLDSLPPWAPYVAGAVAIAGAVAWALAFNKKKSGTVAGSRHRYGGYYGGY